MSVYEIFLDLKAKAAADTGLREKLLDTVNGDHPLTDFCAIAREQGCLLYPMDVIQEGEVYYAAMKRSTNGGGENSPRLRGWDSLYEMFLAELSQTGSH